MNYTIVEIEGRLWKQMPNGSRLLHREKNKKISAVYCLLDLVSGKKYIGSTTDFNSRARQHLQPNKFVGYLLDIHDHTKTLIGIIEEVESGLLLEREAYWIEYYNTKHPFGYNRKHPVHKTYYSEGGRPIRTCSVPNHNTGKTFTRGEKHNVWYGAVYKKKRKAL